MTMKKFLLYIFSVSTFFAATVAADVTFITDHDSGNSFDNAFVGQNCPSSYNICEYPYSGVGIPCEGKFSSCTCSEEYNKPCSSQAPGVGEPCNGKYISCQCPTEYNKICNAPNIPVGGSCNELYAQCACPANYQICPTGPSANAEICIAEGTTEVYYTSCEEELGVEEEPSVACEGYYPYSSFKCKPGHDLACMVDSEECPNMSKSCTCSGLANPDCDERNLPNGLQCALEQYPATLR